MEEKSESKGEKKKELSLEDSFNMLVKLARTNKLNYDEHMIVDGAIKTVFAALNELSDIKESSNKTKATFAKATTTKTVTTK